ncbi:MAG: TrgA family protein [Pararhodobacter sp.]|nr:TrgA family protein [Pararhodobacter sp.]
MYTLIRPLAALALGLLGWLAAEAYRPLNVLASDSVTFALWTAGISAAVGWRFPGSQIGRKLWFSVYASLQAVALAALATSALFALRQVFILGYRRQYREPMDAFTGYFDILVSFLVTGFERDFLILLGVGGVVIGLALHVLNQMMERRRLTR